LKSPECRYKKKSLKLSGEKKIETRLPRDHRKLQNTIFRKYRDQKRFLDPSTNPQRTQTERKNGRNLRQRDGEEGEKKKQISRDSPKLLEKKTINK
jgi:hypothetical protein